MARVKKSQSELDTIVLEAAQKRYEANCTAIENLTVHEGIQNVWTMYLWALKYTPAEGKEKEHELRINILEKWMRFKELHFVERRFSELR